jgi:hypothetical protein
MQQHGLDGLAAKEQETASTSYYGGTPSASPDGVMDAIGVTVFHAII